MLLDQFSNLAKLRSDCSARLRHRAVRPLNLLRENIHTKESSNRYQHYCVRFFNTMADDNTRERQKKIRKAAGYLAVSEGDIGTTKAMELAGFGTPERSSSNWYDIGDSS